MTIPTVPSVLPVELRARHEYVLPDARALFVVSDDVDVVVRLARGQWRCSRCGTKSRTAECLHTFSAAVWLAEHELGLTLTAAVRAGVLPAVPVEGVGDPPAPGGATPDRGRGASQSRRPNDRNEGVEDATEA